ncbi:unnamed protein product [Mucor fragilis]
MLYISASLLYIPQKGFHCGVSALSNANLLGSDLIIEGVDRENQKASIFAGQKLSSSNKRRNTVSNHQPILFKILNSVILKQGHTYKFLVWYRQNICIKTIVV